MKLSNHKGSIVLVNENDESIGAETKINIHKNGLLHREAAIIILNAEKELLIQKRKDDGTYTFSAGGHVEVGETYPQAAIREAKEEIDICLNEGDIERMAKIRMDFLVENFRNNSFIEIFLARKDFKISDFKINTLEVESIKYMRAGEINKLIEKRPECFRESFKKAFVDKKVASSLRK